MNAKSLQKSTSKANGYDFQLTAMDGMGTEHLKASRGKKRRVICFTGSKWKAKDGLQFIKA
jgi:hypothetical protein